MLGSAAKGSGFGLWRFLRVRGQQGRMRWCKSDADKGGLRPVPPHALLEGRVPARPTPRADGDEPFPPTRPCLPPCFPPPTHSRRHSTAESAHSRQALPPRPSLPSNTRPLPPPSFAIRRQSRRPALVRPCHHDLDAALGRGQRPPSVCQRLPRLHVGGGPALRARGLVE
jgi:hypothetical protein